jgi:predicted ATP-binding protein involved in virulence
VRSLNAEQRSIFNHCLYGVKLNEKSLGKFVTGDAGVGKSMVLEAITQTMLRWLLMIEYVFVKSQKNTLVYYNFKVTTEQGAARFQFPCVCAHCASCESLLCH